MLLCHPFNVFSKTLQSLRGDTVRLAARERRSINICHGTAPGLCLTTPCSHPSYLWGSKDSTLFLVSGHCIYSLCCNTHSPLHSSESFYCTLPISSRRASFHVYSSPCRTPCNSFTIALNRLHRHKPFVSCPY